MDETQELDYKAYGHGHDPKKALLMSTGPGECYIYLRSVLRDFPNLASEPDEDGSTPLHYLAFFGLTPQAAEAAKEILKCEGVDVNAKNNKGFTPLHEAAFHWEAAPVARVLLEAGAEVNALGPNNATPIYYASINGSGAVMRLLMDHGADPTMKTTSGKDAYERIIDSEHQDILDQYFWKGYKFAGMINSAPMPIDITNALVVRDGDDPAPCLIKPFNKQCLVPLDPEEYANKLDTQEIVTIQFPRGHKGLFCVIDKNCGK